MKVTISETMFETLLKAIKGSAARYANGRPALEYIRIKVESGKISVMVCDGYSGARFNFAAKSHDGEDFICLIKPITFKASKNGTLPVTIELVDGEALVDVPTAYGNLTYHFKQVDKYDEKLDDIFDKMKIHDREIGVNPDYMARIMRNFASVLRGIHPVIIESKERENEGFCMRAKSEQFEFEQFLLPVRIIK